MFYATESFHSLITTSLHWLLFQQETSIKIPTYAHIPQLFSVHSVAICHTLLLALYAYLQAASIPPFPVIRQTYLEVPSISGGRSGEYEWTAIFAKRNEGLWSAVWGYRASDPVICTVCCLFLIAVLFSRATLNDDTKLPCMPHV